MVKNIYSLTPLQEGMLFHSLYRDKNETPYFEQMVFDVNGNFNVDLFQDSWNEIIKRYDVFRTIFIHKNTQTPKQVVLKKSNIKFNYYDILTNKNKNEYLSDFIKEDINSYFNLSKTPPLRVNIFKIEENKYRVIFSFHHILMDGWSGGIVFDELFKIYNSLKENNSIDLPPVKPYSLYIKWLKEQNKEDMNNFWKNYISDYTQEVIIPTSSKTKDFKLAKDIFFIDEYKTKKLNKFVQNNGLTLNSLMQTVWGVLLSKLNNSNDIVFGATVSGRVDDITGIENMVGLFINAIPVRVKYQNNETFLNLLLKIMKESISAKKYHYTSLADIQNMTILKDKLINQLMVFENYPRLKNSNENSGFEVEILDNFSQTNYNFDITIRPSNSIEVMFKYNSLLYNQELILNIQNSFYKLIDIILDEPEIEIGKIELDNFPKNSISKEKKDIYNIFISSTFTAEPIENSLSLWGDKFNLDLSVSFSGYNQVFQDLLNKQSQIYNPNSLNILMIRFQDILRFLNLTNKEDKKEAIEDNYNQLIDILNNTTFNAPTFFTIFEPNKNELYDYLKELNKNLIKILATKKNIFIINFQDIDKLYQVDNIFDIQQDKIGHIPFTEEYYYSMGTYLFRQIHSFYKPHFKVIALDCDKTIWKGIVGEDGALGIKIEDGYLELQKFIIEKEKDGFLIVLNSKNNENDVWEVFEKNKNMLLTRDKIVNYKINWQMKSQNLKDMAKELNVGLDSFIFIDDNPLECSEVIENAPEVLTILLPKNPKSFKLFLNHIWAFDKLKITAEDKNRTKMYIAQTKREKSADNLSLDKFLISLKLKIYMNKMFKSQLDRVSQLTKRTNQFNTTTIRREESDIQNLLKNKDYVCWTINVEDKFGDYGLVGVVISKKVKNSLVIDTFLMSCRVLGRGVENSILAGLKEYSEQNNLSKIEIPFYRTAKNQPALDFIHNSKFELFDKTKDGEIYKFDTKNLPKAAFFVDFYFDKTEDILNKDKIIITTQENIIIKDDTKNKTNNKLINDFDFNFLDSLEDNIVLTIKHKKFYEPLKFHKSSDNLQFINSDIKRVIKVKYIKPKTKNELTLANIYKTLLNIDKVGVEDCFFELGGHSLLATRLLSQIYQSFKIELTLRDIFNNSTISKLLKLLNNNKTIDRDTIPKIAKKDYYEVSSSQKRVWLIDKMGGGVAYNMPIVLQMDGDLDIKKLENAFNNIISRHEILRTIFITIDDKPKQKVIDKLEIKIDILKSDIDNIKTIIKDDAYSSFNLEKLPLFKLKIFKLKKDSYIFYFNMHHIISDGWSLNIITKELTSFYNNKELNKINFQYKDFTYWQNSIFSSTNGKNDKKYWLNKFKEDIQPLDFPTDFPRFSKQTFNGDYNNIDLSEFIEKIDIFNKNNKITLFIFLTAIIKIVLARYTNQKDIILGFPIAGRGKVEFEEQIGFYANTLILRDNIDLNNDFNSLVKEIQNTVLDADKHQYYPFEKLVDELKIKRDISRSPIFDFAISLNSENSYLKLNNIKTNLIDFNYKISQFDISFNFMQNKNRLFLNLNYNSDLFKKESMERVNKHIKILIKNILKDTNKNLKDISFLTKKELKHNFIKTKQSKLSIIELFQKQVSVSQNNIAIIFNNKKITYKELDILSNQVANYLIDKENIVINDTISLLTKRSELTIIALLAILKTQSIFLPLNISLPKDRIDYIIKDSNTKLILDEVLILKALKYSKTTNINYKKNIVNNSSYIIYTSGTTGEPKGVEILEKSLLNLLDWYIKDFKIDDKNKTLLMIPTSFDASIKNIFAPLLVGGRVVISNEQFDPFKLIKTIKKEKINLINCVPSAFKSILDISKNYKELKSLRYLAFGGETLDISLFKDFYLNSKVNIFNIYGPTEATDISTIYKINNKDLNKKDIPIGKSIQNSEIYILDRYHNIAPTNVIGEIFIGGIGLAKSYINNKEVTEENFIVDKEFGKLYKTGDFATKLENGNIKFVGRDDEQVKIRGNRIELKEIESTILDLDYIDRVVVLLKDNLLIAYIKSKIAINKLKIKQYLESKLISYMIPTSFVQIDEVPLTTNGKIDKKNLLSINIEPIIDNQVLTNFQKKILDDISKILNRKVHLDDNFFDIGGDSLTAVKVISTINTKYKKSLKLSSIFENQYINEFIKVIDIDKDTTTLPYTIFNKDKKDIIILFPSLLDCIDYKVTASKIANNLKEYKIYAFDFISENNRFRRYAEFINSFENEFVFLAYSSGGNIAVEVIKELKNRQPRKLIFLDSWKINKKNSVNKNDFINSFDSELLEKNKKVFNKYIKMLNKMVNNINYYSNIQIHLIKSLDINKTNDKIRRDWINNIKYYNAYGSHLDMLNKQNLIKNLNIVKNILLNNKGN